MNRYLLGALACMVISATAADVASETDGSSLYGDLTLRDGSLSLNLAESSPLEIEVRDLDGTLLSRQSQAGRIGSNQIALELPSSRSKVVLLRLTVGDRSEILRCLPMGNGRWTTTGQRSTTGFLARALPVKSPGCGKSLGTLRTGNNILKLSSGGYQREYTINIPANYNVNNPYRLIFAWHWINSTDDAIVNLSYYGLKQQADSARQPAIFIAPQSRTGIWGQEDHVFFDNMLKQTKNTLCIDTGRVFSSGFSFGAMMTYSLSLGKQGQLRAVAAHSPANYNIYMPTNTRKPIAYIATTGMSDGTTPWIAGTNRGGLYCALTHATDNGCTLPASVPTAKVGSKSHLAYNFTNCRSDYPTRVITFDGSHNGAPVDGSTVENWSKSWVPREVWKFFAQF